MRRPLSDGGMPQRPLSLFVLVTLSACTRRPAQPAEQWARWFNGQASQLDRWDGSSLPAPDGPTLQTPDGLSVRLGRNFGKRNDYGCWDSGADTWRRPGWRDVCVSRLVSEDDPAPHFFLRPEPPDPAISDQHQSEQWQVGLVSFGGRRGVVERARVSGGIEGAKQERRTAILIELPSGGWAHLRGATGDERGYGELLGIAATIRAR